MSPRCALKRAGAPSQARNFRSVGTDPHNFDVDPDEIACEE